MNINELKLREIILNTRKPIVFRKFKKKWRCFEGTLETWCKRFDDSLTILNKFERMPIRYWNKPQWERDRIQVKMTCQDFFKYTNEVCNYWIGLNYKRVAEIPAVCREGLEFACFGFPQVGDDASFWLSSKGANTPCHYDTYSCNIVIQIYGRKSWLLFPPETKLTATRIPYEESSVYCLDNLYSPNSSEIEKIQPLADFAFHCILEPNDVLIVPRGWWHYVESLETSLSVNAWVPLECDIEAQIEECIVKFLMERFATGETESNQIYMLNPNQLNQISDDAELFAVLSHLINARESSQASSKQKNKTFPYQYLDEEKVNEMLNDFSTAEVVQRLTSSAFNEMLKTNSTRFDEQLQDNDTPPMNSIKEHLINSICHPDIVHLIKQKFYKGIEENSRDNIKKNY